ncbi:retrotransposon gag domain, retroviral aspartyl protease [Tanacetum coccineum]
MPRNVFKAVSLALEFEVKSRPASNPRTSNSINDNKPSSYSTSSHDPIKLSATYPNASSSAQSQNWESERQNLEDKGLCFRCKEKFAPRHRCKLATFSLLEISNDNEHLVDREVEVNENEYEEGINQQDMAEISFHAILSKTLGTTMKVEGTLEGRKVLTLVDSGSTHNFISTSLVKQLGLKVSTVPSFGVQIGNGKIIQCNQICCGFSLVLPGLKITEDYFPFFIRGADLVLGIKWLASLNTVQANWNEMFMIFYVNEKKYKLKQMRLFNLIQNFPMPLQIHHDHELKLWKIKELMLFQGGHNIMIFYPLQVNIYNFALSTRKVLGGKYCYQMKRLRTRHK